MRGRALAVLVVLAIIGCDDPPPSDVMLDHKELACPSDSLEISTTIDGGFQPGAVVTFTNSSATYDGSAVVLPNGTIDCGFPPNAMAGEYEVHVNGMAIGVVKLDSSTC